MCLIKVPYINVLVIPRFSLSKTENELTSYLAEKFLDHAMKTNLQVVGTWGYQCRAAQQNGNHLQSDLLLVKTFIRQLYQPGSGIHTCMFTKNIRRIGRVSSKRRVAL